MIDVNKKYTYNGKPVRIYADGSDTYNNNIHGAVRDDEFWTEDELPKTHSFWKRIEETKRVRQ